LSRRGIVLSAPRATRKKNKRLGPALARFGSRAQRPTSLYRMLGLLSETTWNAPFFHRSKMDLLRRHFVARQDRPPDLAEVEVCARSVTMDLADVAVVVLVVVLVVVIVGLLTCHTVTGTAESDCQMVAEAEVVVDGHHIRKL
jgi:hypothetical protein